MTSDGSANATRRCSSASASSAALVEALTGAGSPGRVSSKGPPGSARAGCWPSCDAGARARRRSRRCGPRRRPRARLPVRRRAPAVRAARRRPRARERLLAGAAAGRAVFEAVAPRAAERRRLVRRAARALLAGRQPRRGGPAAACRRRPALVRRAVAALPRLPRAAGSTARPIVLARALRTRRARHRPGAARRDRADPLDACALRRAPLSEARRGDADRGAPRRRAGRGLHGRLRRGHRRQPAAAAPAAHVARRATACADAGDVGRRRADRPARGVADVLLPPRRLGEAIAVARALAVLGEARSCAPSPRWPAARRAQVAARGRATLARAEILRPEPPLGFVHPLVRDAVYHDLPLGERELQHEPRARRCSPSAGAAGEQVARTCSSRAAPRRPVASSSCSRAAARVARRRGGAGRRSRVPARALEEPPPPERARACSTSSSGRARVTPAPAAVEHLARGVRRARRPASARDAADARAARSCSPAARRGRRRRLPRVAADSVDAPPGAGSARRSRPARLRLGDPLARRPAPARRGRARTRRRRAPKMLGRRWSRSASR